MKIDARLESLQKKYETIQSQIHDLEVHHQHYEDEVQELKRQRLIIKDQMYQLIHKLDEIG